MHSNQLKELSKEGQAKEIYEYINEWEEYLMEAAAADEDISNNSEQILQEILQSATSNTKKYCVFKTTNSTRWNTHEIMLKSFIKSYCKQFKFNLNYLFNFSFSFSIHQCVFSTIKKARFDVEQYRL